VQGETAVKLLWLRWGLLGIFVIAARDPHNLGPSFVGLNLVALLACALLLTRLGGPARTTLWIWIILFVFLDGYFVKALWLLGLINPPTGQIHERFPELAWVTLGDITEAYFWTTLAFVVFCVTSWLLLGSVSAPALAGRGRPLAAASTSRVQRVLIAAFVLMIIADALKLVLGIGVMGSVADRLPLGLDTLIFRLRSDILPAVLLLCISCLDHPKSRWSWLTGMALLVLSAALTSVVSTSRGALLVSVLPVVFVWLVSGRFTTGRKWFLGVIVLLTMLAFPLISALRYVQLLTPGDLSENVGLAFSITQQIDRADLLANSFAGLVSRVGGMDGLLHIIGHEEHADLERGPGWLWRLLVAESVPVYHTRDVVGVTTPGDFRAPGFLGGFILLVGSAGAIALVALFVVAMGVLWRWLQGLRTAPVALALCAQYILGFTSEGTMQWQQAMSLLVVILTCEWLYRVVLREPGAMGAQDGVHAEPRPGASTRLAQEQGL
jgi:hypothetical protein